MNDTLKHMQHVAGLAGWHRYEQLAALAEGVLARPKLRRRDRRRIAKLYAAIRAMTKSELATDLIWRDGYQKGYETAQADLEAPAGDEDEEDYGEPYCITCGVTIGIFIGQQDKGWQHFRPFPDGIYDAGHPAAVAWRASAELRGPVVQSLVRVAPTGVRWTRDLDQVLDQLRSPRPHRAGAL